MSQSVDFKIILEYDKREIIDVNVLDIANPTGVSFKKTAIFDNYHITVVAKKSQRISSIKNLTKYDKILEYSVKEDETLPQEKFTYCFPENKKRLNLLQNDGNFVDIEVSVEHYRINDRLYERTDELENFVQKEKRDKNDKVFCNIMVILFLTFGVLMGVLYYDFSLDQHQISLGYSRSEVRSRYNFPTIFTPQYEILTLRKKNEDLNTKIVEMEKLIQDTKESFKSQFDSIKDKEKKLDEKIAETRCYIDVSPLWDEYEFVILPENKRCSFEDGIFEGKRCWYRKAEKTFRKASPGDCLR